MKPRKTQSTLLTKPREIIMTICVRKGSSSLAPKSLNILSKPGMTKMSKIESTPKKTTMTIDGYISAPRTWRDSFIAFSM